MTYATISHCPSKDKIGDPANLLHFPDSNEKQKEKIQMLIDSAKVVVDTNLSDRPLLTDRSIMIAYGNAFPTE